MSLSKHPWYPTWQYQRKHEGFPWKQDARSFFRWLERAGYNPQYGDSIRHDSRPGYYRLYITGPRGEQPLQFIATDSTQATEALKHSHIISSLRAFYSGSVPKPSTQGDFALIVPERAWFRLLLDLGVTDDEIDQHFLQPAELDDLSSPIDVSEEISRDVWKRMHASCYNTSAPAYEAIGALGVRVDTEWHDFAAFKKWVDSEIKRTRRDANKPFTLARFSASKDYGPDNCKIMT